MTLPRTLGLAAIASLLWLSVAEAEVDGFHIGVTPYVGGADWDEPLADNNFLYGGRVGLFLNSWIGVEGHYGLSPTETPRAPVTDIDIRSYGADLIVNLMPGKLVVPYILGGWTEFDVRPDAGSDFKVNGWEAGGGLKFQVNERIGLRAEFRDAIVDGLGADQDEWRHNFIYTAGLQFDLFGRIADDDGDGIGNRKDVCAATPKGARVDARGCPTDGDGDGVFDGMDRCENTPAGAIVDAIGCPIDSDGDGIVDGIDRCADTPRGASVDSRGCPIDGDGDGVADGLDECPNTPTGAPVDARGCPKDSDGDGIVDGVDQCPNTPRGSRVDAKGCRAMETMLLDTGLIRLENIKFESAKADLKAESTAILDSVGSVLVSWPQLRIEVAGHTDSQGSEAFNQTLSEERAQSVLDYLARNFPTLQMSQFTVVGYGESQPVADNRDATGRALNRRVEFKALNKEVLKREVPADQ